MKIILLPIDGSAAAGKALAVALDLAAINGAAILLLHVRLRNKEPGELLRLTALAEHAGIIEALQDLAAGPVTEHSAEEIMAAPNRPDRPVPPDLLDRIGRVLLDQAQTAAEARDVAVRVLEICDGAPGKAIVAAASANGANAIVMGMRGLSQIEAFTFGSVSQEVCQQAPCTCIAVH